MKVYSIDRKRKNKNNQMENQQKNNIPLEFAHNSQVTKNVNSMFWKTYKKGIDLLGFWFQGWILHHRIKRESGVLPICKNPELFPQL